MKIQYKLGIIGLCLIAFSSCVEDEPYEDNIEIEKPTTACNWDVSSLVCKAGDTFSFKGVYSSEKEYTFSHSEVWYDIIRIDEISVSAKLGIPYTKAISSETLVLNKQVFKFDHSLTTWNGEKFELIGSVPVSETLTPITWDTPKEWGSSEINKFAAYFPKGFAEEFENAVDSLIVTDDYYSALRILYINYPFTNERFAEINNQFGTEFPTDIAYDESDAQAGATDKSIRWIDYYNPKVWGKEAPIVGYYYLTTESGVKIYNMIDETSVIKDEFGTYRYVDNQSIIVYPVYESAPWVFSRYEDDWGLVKSTVLPQYIEAFKALIEPITFQEWIYSHYDGYALTFKRKYVLDTSFRVVELDGNVTTAENNYNITIN